MPIRWSTDHLWEHSQGDVLPANAHCSPGHKFHWRGGVDTVNLRAPPRCWISSPASPVTHLHSCINTFLFRPHWKLLSERGAWKQFGLCSCFPTEPVFTHALLPWTSTHMKGTSCMCRYKFLNLLVQIWTRHCPARSPVQILRKSDRPYVLNRTGHRSGREFIASESVLVILHSVCSYFILVFCLLVYCFPLFPQYCVYVQIQCSIDINTKWSYTTDESSSCKLFRHHQLPKPGGVFPVGENASRTISCCVLLVWKHIS